MCERVSRRVVDAPVATCGVVRLRCSVIEVRVPDRVDTEARSGPVGGRWRTAPAAGSRRRVTAGRQQGGCREARPRLISPSPRELPTLHLHRPSRAVDVEAHDVALAGMTGEGCARPSLQCFMWFRGRLSTKARPHVGVPAASRRRGGSRGAVVRVGAEAMKPLPRKRDAEEEGISRAISSR